MRHDSFNELSESLVSRYFRDVSDHDLLTPAQEQRLSARLTRLFDTRFYIADLGTGAVEIEADLAENTHLFWTSAQGALDAAEKGQIKIIFPTRRNLERLAQFDSFVEAKEHAERFEVRTITPFTEKRDGRQWLCIDDDLGYPVTAEAIETVARR